MNEKIEVKLTRKEIEGLIMAFREFAISRDRKDEVDALRSAICYLGARIGYCSKFDADLIGRLREDGLWPLRRRGHGDR